MSPRALLPVAAGTLAVLGAAAIVAAATIPPSTGAAPPAPAPSAAASTPTAPAHTPTPVPTVTGAPAGGLPVHERADGDWVDRTAEAAAVPARALAAYAGAALAVADTHPGCGLGWNTLAAIGEVESAHGTLQGGTIGADGRVQPRVLGVPLDGSPGVASIRDTDGGALDGDTAWDRAVGPMQFLPTTWAEHAQDGDRDGSADVDDLDDAALAAAVYLCDAGGDLTDPAGWIAAVHAYNPSAEYNARVAGAAERLAALP